LFSFRQAVQSDLIALLQFNLSDQELFYFFPAAQPPLTLEQLQQQLNERYQSTVMLEDDKVVGFANFYNVKNHNLAFIGNVVIDPEKRRQRLGSRLVRTIIDKGFKELKLRQIHLSCYNDNNSALLFYHSLGFKPYAMEKRKDWENKDTILLHLKLKKP
jgi:ribosomal protein S18 acetylase RimI-like enzyme